MTDVFDTLGLCLMITLTSCNEQEQSSVGAAHVVFSLVRHQEPS